MVEFLQKHVGAELAGDLETTMNTMTEEPHLHNIPSMGGGVGREGVRAFYRDHLVGKFFPPDVKMTNVSSTVGSDQVQIGLLDPTGSPVSGAQSAHKVLDPQLPSRQM